MIAKQISGSFAGGEVMGYLKRRIIEDMEPTEYELARRWIPVSERLPEERVEVLLHYDDGSMEVGRHLGLGCVTHWMPLPEPPEVK